MGLDASIFTKYLFKESFGSGLISNIANGRLTFNFRIRLSVKSFD